MTKDLKILAFLLVSASVWFIFNPIQDTEINMKLQILCDQNPEYKCGEIISYCMEALSEGKECYLTK